MKNSSKKASSTGKGNLAEAKDRLVGSFDPEKFLRDNPMLAVELLLLMVGEDLTPTKFFGKVSADFPGMEVTHAEELVLLFLFLRGKSARSTSSEKDDQRDEAYVKKADSAPASGQSGKLPKARRIKSFDDLVEWLGGKESAHENLLIRIENAGSIAKFSEKLKVNAGTMSYWVKKIKEGVFAKPSKKSGLINSDKEHEVEDSKIGSDKKEKIIGLRRGSVTERVVVVLKDKETAKGIMLKYGSLQALTNYFNEGKRGGENPITSMNLAFILKSRFGLIFRDVLKEGGLSGSGLSESSFGADSVAQKLSGVDRKIKDALVKEARRIEILSEDQKNKLVALAIERKASSLKSLFTLLDDNGNDLPEAAKVLCDLGIIKRNTPVDYVPLKRAVFGA